MAEQERLYDYTNQRETGEEHNLYWNNFSKKLTKDQLREQFNAKDNGQLRAAFGDFDNYMAYMEERQNFIDVGLLKADWWDTGEALIDPENVSRELGMDDRGLEKYIVDRGVELSSGAYNDQAAILLSLYTKYTGIEGNSWYNNDGDRFEWNGTSFVKTNKIDDSFDVNDTILALGAAGLTAGAINPILGALNKALSAANIGTVSFSNAQLAVNALTTAIRTGGDPKAIAGSVLGAVVGDYFASNLVNFTGAGSGLIDAAAANAISTAVSQGITDGSLDLNDILKSGLMGAGVAGAGELINSLVSGEAFDLDGLISEDSDLYGIFNGTDDSAGLLAGIRGSFNEFTEKYITGGDFWESATERFKSVTENSDGTLTAIGYDGSEVPFNSWDDFINAGFQEISGTNPFWDLISQAGGAIPDDWLDQLNDWLNGRTSSSGGTYKTEGGTTVTVSSSSDDDGDGDDDTFSDDFDCSSINRQQVEGATTGTECGPCVKGYEVNEFEQCVETIGEGTCPEGQYYNEISLQCEDEIGFTKGAPCNAADGEQGTYNEEGECIVPDGGGEGGGDGNGGGDGEGPQVGDPCTEVVDGVEQSGTIQEDDAGNTYCFIQGTGGEGPQVDDPCDSNGDGTDDGTIDKNGNCIPNDPVKTVCNDRNATNYGEDGECTYSTECDDPSATNYGEEGECTYESTTSSTGTGGNNVDTSLDAFCREGLPGDASFAVSKWRNECGPNYCQNGTPKREVDGVYGANCAEYTAPTSIPCRNGATRESNCETCPDGSLPSQHEDDNCDKPQTVSGPGTGGNETDCTLVECDAPRPEGDAGDLWDECCSDTTITTTSSAGSGGSGGYGGGSDPFKPYEPSPINMGLTGDPTLLSGRLFPITDYLSGLFTGPGDDTQ